MSHSYGIICDLMSHPECDLRINGSRLDPQNTEELAKIRGWRVQDHLTVCPMCWPPDADQPQNEFEDLHFPKRSWVTDVWRGDTMLGYWDWVRVSRIETGPLEP